MWIFVSESLWKIRSHFFFENNKFQPFLHFHPVNQNWLLLHNFASLFFANKTENTIIKLFFTFKRNVTRCWKDHFESERSKYSYRFIGLFVGWFQHANGPQSIRWRREKCVIYIWYARDLKRWLSFDYESYGNRKRNQICDI